MSSASRCKLKSKLKKGDEVIVLTGRSRGKTGKIENIFPNTDQVIVSGVNFYKKHQKPNMAYPDGGIIDKAVPLNLSNIALVDPKSKKATRVGYKMDNGNKVRFAKKSGTVLS